MAYRISYDSVGKYRQKKEKNRKGIFIAVLVLVLVIGAITVKSVGLTWVQEVLLPGDPAVTAAALEGMVENLRNGENLYDAITAFCREIIKYGQHP